jgi:GT2 family glycosyltransferase
VKLLTVNAEEPLPDIPSPVVGEQWVLVRVHREPLGILKFTTGGCTASELAERIENRFDAGLARHFAADWMTSGIPPDRRQRICPRLRSLPDLSVTVAVCTRDGASRLGECLAALATLDYPSSLLDLLVVDNAPKDDAVRRLIETHFPHVRYVVEPRPGLDRARNRAILEARGEIIAFTDDDVSVDRWWVDALARLFTADPGVDAVTGLVVPDAIDVDAHRLFEQYGGFGRGYDRQYFRVDDRVGEPASVRHGGSGRFGTGANMAFRRRLFDRIGLFDPALDVGTPTNGGGDLEMLFRVLKHGGTLVYEPSAIVRHRHRGSYAALREQLTNNGIGFYAYLVRTARVYDDERTSVMRLGIWWMAWWNVRRLARAMVRRDFPIDLILAEARGSWMGLFRYPGGVPESAIPASSVPQQQTHMSRSREWPIAVRTVDASKPLQPLSGLAGYSRVRVFVRHEGRMVGARDIWTDGADTVQVVRLADAISASLGRDLLWLASRPADLRAPDSRRVSIVVPSCDRPEDLRQCLMSLTTQRTRHAVEVIVVDNRPEAGSARRVAREFMSVQVIDEPRPGLSFARNAGIIRAQGEVVVATDDDVVAPEDWIERLVAPFADPDVMAVTGNVLPLELETEAQCRFEAYGGLGKGYRSVEVDGEWFRTRRMAVPTWQLGATANAAFRSAVFRDPRIGLLDEALGAGTPTGCSEDTDLFYRILKAGHTIRYEPTACVWHRHRRTMKDLRAQIYAYSKGHVAYHLTTWLRYGDRRALLRLFYSLPKAYAVRTWHRLRGYSEYPVSLIGLEIAGNLAGPFALWAARRRARRLGVTPPLDGAAPIGRHAVSMESQITEGPAA